MSPCKSVGTLSAFVALGFMGAIVAASPGRADTIKIGFYEPTASISYSGLANSSTGTASFNAGEGTYVTVDVSATGYPVHAQPGLYTTNLSITGGESAPETYYVYITQSGITGPTGTPSLGSAFGVTQLSGQMTSVTINTYVDPNDHADGGINGPTNAWLGTLLATETCTTSCSTSSTNTSPVTLGNPFAETIEYIISTKGFTGTQVQGEFDGTASIDSLSNISNQEPTPLPAALPLFAGGLGVLGLLARRRKQKNAAALAAA
jgi:hypothetical protein